MYIYIIVLIVLFLNILFYKKDSNNMGFTIVSLCILYLLTVLKSPISGDYARYANHFFLSGSRTIEAMSAMKGEIAFHTMTKIIRLVTDNSVIYFAFTTAIIYICLGYYINKNSENKVLSIYCYYTIGLFAFTLAGLRQSIAMSICLFAYEAIKQKKVIRFVIIVFFASLFHRSAYLFLFAYLAAYMKWKWNHFAIAVFVYGVVWLSFLPLYDRIAFWLGYDNYGIETTGNGGVFLLILIIIGVLAILYKKPLLEKNYHNLVFLNLHIMTIALWGFRIITRTVERPIFFYLFSSTILMEQIFSIELKTFEEKRLHKLLLFIALVLFGLLFVYRTARDKNLVPYINILA